MARCVVWVLQLGAVEDVTTIMTAAPPTLGAVHIRATIAAEWV